MSEAVKVDIWSDVACPWCFVGKRRFEKAAASFAEDGGSVEIEYHSFELSPETPVDYDGSEIEFLSRHKGISVDQARQMLDQMTQLAASEGLAYDYDALKHANTRKAHELLHFAKAHGKQLEMKERLLSAYFEQGRVIGRPDALAELAAEIGLDRDEALAALESGRYATAVRDDKEQADAYGIHGVPFFVLGGRFGVSGAQDPSVFLNALRRAAAE